MLPEQFLEPSIIYFRVGWNPDSKWTKVRFDGAVLSTLDIKRCLMQHENLFSDPDVYDLVLTNKQTGEEFRNEGFLVPRNSVLVARKIPSTKAASQRIREPPLTVESAKDKSQEDLYGGGRIVGKPTTETDAAVADFLAKGDDYAEVDHTNFSYVSGIPNPREEFSKSSGGFGGLRFAYRFDPMAKPPPGYICHRCDQPGHFIRFCPTNDDPEYNFKRIKPATGIPVSFMKPASESKDLLQEISESTPLLSLGNKSEVQAVANERQFARSLAESGTQIQPTNSKTEKKPKAPPLNAEFLCPLCIEPFVNAVMPTCCFASFCDVCIRLYLIASSLPQCPSCGSKECSFEILQPNKTYQKAVDEYIEKHPEKANSRLKRHFKTSLQNQNNQINPEFINPLLTSSQTLNQIRNRVINPNNTCFRCGQRGHYMADCINKADPHAYNPIHDSEEKVNLESSHHSHSKTRKEKPRYTKKLSNSKRSNSPRKISKNESFKKERPRYSRNYKK